MKEQQPAEGDGAFPLCRKGQSGRTFQPPEDKARGGSTQCM